MVTKPPPRLPPRFTDNVPELLADAGYDLATAQSLMDLDRTFFFWHRIVIKGEIQGQLISELGVDLELTQFHALTAILRIQNGIGRADPAAPTIGLLAEEMNLDPSRASRIASDLIARGYLRREVAQDDGRKTVLALTDKAVATFIRFKDLKWAKMVDVFAGWADNDITTFARLLDRYVQDVAQVYQR